MLFTFRYYPPLCQNLLGGYELLLRNVWAELEYKCDIWQATHGAVIERCKLVNVASHLQGLVVLTSLGPINPLNLSTLLP